MKEIVREMDMNKIEMCLCESRHEMPVEKAVFPNTINPLDIEGMEAVAEDAISNISHLILYVTGLTVALVAVINACHKKNVHLTLMHYNRESGNYYPQKVY